MRKFKPQRPRSAGQRATGALGLTQAQAYAEGDGTQRSTEDGYERAVPGSSAWGGLLMSHP